ncbi:uncharacterized protein ACB058_015568 isoform 1-T2 [Synchiropus picturatus]
MIHRGGWIRTRSCAPLAAGPPRCAGEEARGTHGGSRCRAARKSRQEGTSVMSAKVKVVLWVLLSLLPVMEGAHMSAGFGSESGRVVDLLGGQEERELPVRLPELMEEEEEEEEEQEEDSDPYSPWHTLYEPFVMAEVDDHPSSRWVGRSPRSSDPSEPPTKVSPKKKKKRKKKEKEEETKRSGKRGKGKGLKQSSRDCRVEKKEMKVRDLGLGYDSDEIVLFKFCVGSCQSSRKNYDLVLETLMENGSLPRRTARRVSNHPCCRPDSFEPVTFMDAQTKWQTIEEVSAASCMCTG